MTWWQCSGGSDRVPYLAQRTIDIANKMSSVTEMLLHGLNWGEMPFKWIEHQDVLSVSGCLGQGNFCEHIKHACLTNVLAFALQICLLRKVENCKLPDYFRSISLMKLPLVRYSDVKGLYYLIFIVLHLGGKIARNPNSEMLKLEWLFSAEVVMINNDSNYEQWQFI